MSPVIASSASSFRLLSRKVGVSNQPRNSLSGWSSKDSYPAAFSPSVTFTSPSFVSPFMKVTVYVAGSGVFWPLSPVSPV